MALTISLLGQGLITNAETATGWAKTGLISTPVDETDNFLQGTQCVSTKASNKDGALYYDIGAGNELDYTAGTGANAGEHLYLAINMVTLANTDTVANGGLRIWVGSSATDFYEWTIHGDDDIARWNNGTGGFKFFVIDPTKTPTTTGGSFNIASVRYFGAYVNMAGTTKSENLLIDTMISTTGLRVTGTSNQLWTDVADYCTAYASRAWPVVQKGAGDEIVLFGPIFIGSSSASAVTSVTDGGKLLKFGSQEYYNGSAWVESVASSFMGITIEDHASFSTTFQDGTLVGTNEGRNGSTFVGSDLHSLSIDPYGGNNAASITKFHNTTFRGIDGGIAWGNDPDHEFFSGVVDQSGQFDPVGSPEIKNAIFSNTTDASGALLWNASAVVASSKFIGNTTGPAIAHLDGAGSAVYDGLQFSGSTYDIYASVNGSTVDSYASTNNDTDVDLAATNNAVAQTFAASSATLTRARFQLKKTGNPTGSIVSKLFQTSGGAPTGTEVATSETVIASAGVSTGYTTIDFPFTDEYTMVGASTYAVAVEYTGGDASNYITVGVDNSTPGHSGTGYLYTASWASQTWDACFYLIEGGIFTINATNGSNPAQSKALTVGAPAGVAIVKNAVTLTVNVENAVGSAIASAQTSIFKADPVKANRAQYMNQDTNASGIAATTFNYPGSDVDIVVKVRKSDDADSPRYFAKSQTGVIKSTGFTLNVTLEENPFI